MILGSQRKLEGTEEYLNVKIGGNTVEQSHCENVPGLYLDSSLTWSDHVFKCIKKFNSKLGLIRRAKPYLSPNHMLLLYSSTAKPTIEYCCSVWGNCSSELLQQVLLAQKRTARLLLNAETSCCSLELFQKLKICPFSDIVRQRILNLTFKSLNDLFHDSMANLFKRPSHRYATRAKTNLSLTIPKAKTNAGKRRFSYMAPTIWNSIPGHLHLITSPKAFNNKYKHLFQQRLETATELSIERLH